MIALISLFNFLDLLVLPEDRDIWQMMVHPEDLPVGVY